MPYLKTHLFATISLFSILLMSQLAQARSEVMVKLDRLISNQNYSEAKDIFKQNFFLNESEKVEYEFLKWKVYSALIPTDANFCTANPKTFRCDDGAYLNEQVALFNELNSNNPYAEDMKKIADKFYQYQVKHEKLKLDEYVLQYESAVHPKGKLSQFIVNDLRKNNQRTDGTVYANCVGGTETLPGKCDLVQKHSLLTRILNQIYFMESFLDVADMNGIAKIGIQYLKELQALVQSAPQIEKDVYPTFKDLNYEAEIFRLASGEFQKSNLQSNQRVFTCKNEGVCTVEQKLKLMEADGRSARELLNSSLQQIQLQNEKSFFIPLSLNDSELITLAAATSLGIVAFSNDEEIMSYVQKNKTSVSNKIENVGNFIGSGLALPVLAAGTYFLGVVYKDNKIKKAGLFAVGATIAAAVVTTAFKETFQRSRPNADRGAYDFLRSGNKSFFSGHASQAFAIATIISEMYKEDHPVVPYVAYSIASLTAYARMSDNAHWASDVIIGAVAGHLVAKLFLSAMNGNQERRGGLKVYPSFDPIHTSLMLMFEYRKPYAAPEPKCARIQNRDEKIAACIEEAFQSSK